MCHVKNWGRAWRVDSAFLIGVGVGRKFPKVFGLLASWQEHPFSFFLFFLKWVSLHYRHADDVDDEDDEDEDNDHDSAYLTDKNCDFKQMDST